MVTESSVAVVAALYGIQNPAVDSYTDIIVRWLRARGLNFDKAVITLASGDTLSGRFEDVFSKSRPCRQYLDVSLYILLPDARVMARDHLVALVYSKRLDCVALSVRRSVVSFDADEWRAIVGDLVTLVRPWYGIAYERPAHLGPVMFAIGISQGLGFASEDLKAASEISRWGSTGLREKVYMKGLLRDVYRWNILSEVHLNSRVGGMALDEWIKNGQGTRGAVDVLADGRWLWRVPPEGLDAMRRALRGEGLLWV
ncbi:MAG: hypothetical protein WBX15_07025 [Thermoanaerobaculia bacterium]